jgi:23S rRNA pseudouridine2605 synthase
MERLNKALAAAGFGSRRESENLIRAGRVAVNGAVVTDLGHKIGSDDTLMVDGRPVERQPLVYWVVNKPRGYLSTNKDPAGRPRVIDLLMHVPERVYTVGRLDEASEGLLLLTNDGDLALRLTHPRYGVEKTYIVQVAGHPTIQDIQQLTRGVRLSEGLARAARATKIGTRGDSTFVRIVLAEGKNREIRRMLAKLGHKVMSLRRVAIGPVQLGHLRRGKSRRLMPGELEALKRIAHRAPAPVTTRPT